jgi:hypothetical protein
MQHPDFVQFFTTGTTAAQASQNINIHDNVFLMGNGTGVQGVFLGNEAGVPYKNVSITNNMFYTSFWNGIAVYKADGVVIDNNTVVNVPNNSGTFEGKPMVTNASWVLVDHVTNAQVTDNVASRVRFDYSTGTQSGNVNIAWNGQKGVLTYADVLSNGWAGASANIDDFQVKSAYAGKGTVMTPLYQAGSATATAPADHPDAMPAPLPPSSPTISGTEARDQLTGTAAAETILARGGSDFVNAGGGNDTLDGGAGKDWMAGQGGDDVYVFSSVAEIGKGSSRDVLNAWGEGLNGRGNDTIDLRALDANTAVTGDQAFSWLGTGDFTGKAGELRAYFDGTNTIVEGTVNADTTADFQIEISGKVTLATNDFLF